MEFTLEYTYDKENNSWIISITGEIDIFNSDDLKTKLLALVKETSADLVIDCTNLEYIDSTALGALVVILKNVKQNNKNIYLNNLKPNLLKLFKITKLDSAFMIGGELIMPEKNQKYEKIKLTLPINAAYVSAARLTSSSIAYRMGYSIEEIEDIKAAVSETCAFIIKKCPHIDSSFKITFEMHESSLKITIELEKSFKIENLNDEISIIMLKALVDKLDFKYKEDKLISIEILKEKNEQIFDY